MLLSAGRVLGPDGQPGNLAFDIDAGRWVGLDIPCGDGQPRTTDKPYSSISLALHYDPTLKLAILLGNSQQEVLVMRLERAGLKTFGYEDGHTIRIEQRYAGGNNDQLRVYARELAAMNLKVIVVDGTLSSEAATAATNAIPIISVIITDPARLGMRGPVRVERQRQVAQPRHERMPDERSRVVRADVDVVAGVRLCRWRVDGMRQSIGLAQSGGQGDAAHGTEVLVLLPSGA